jgi:hypothetical protein
MTKEIVDRRASDNEYLHKDFHGALSAGIEYIHKNYGQQAVLDYLRQFALAYYSPLMEELQKRGLIALKEHFENMYQLEGGEIEITLSDDELILKVDACPAVIHMRANGYPVAELFHETTKTVNETICEGSEFVFELVEYEPETGRSVQRFYRRLK